MAQSLLIKTANTTAKFVGDVIGIFEDVHKFSDYELQVFNVLYINGSREDVQSKFHQLKLRVVSACYWDQTWHFHPPTEGDVADEIEVWFDTPNRWRILVNEPKFLINVGVLTPEELQILATVDINHPSVDSFLKKILKDITSDPANMEEVRDLRGLEP